MNSNIIDKTIRPIAVEYLERVKKNTKIPEFDIRLTYMSTPAKDKFVIFDHEDLLTVMFAKEPVEVIWNNIVESYRQKGLDTVIEEVNAKAKEMGIQ